MCDLIPFKRLKSVTYLIYGKWLNPLYTRDILCQFRILSYHFIASPVRKVSSRLKYLANWRNHFTKLPDCWLYIQHLWIKVVLMIRHLLVWPKDCQVAWRLSAIPLFCSCIWDWCGRRTLLMQVRKIVFLYLSDTSIGTHYWHCWRFIYI